MSLTRGLHPDTSPQRKEDGDAWTKPNPQEAYEASDAPPRWVALGVGGILLVLVASVLAVAWLTGTIKPRRPIMAEQAEQHFRFAGPPLQIDQGAERSALESRHRAPAPQMLGRAMEQVLREGWGDEAPAPTRAQTALARAKERQ